MSTRQVDRAKWFIGSRMKASGLARKVAAPAMGISEQAVSKHYQGRVGSISYAQLRGLARADLRAAMAVCNAVRVDCETAAVEGEGIAELVESLMPLLSLEQRHDGEEDCAQSDLTHTLGAIVFMRDTLTLPLRRELARRLDAWVDCKLADMDAAAAAIARARALRHRLSEEV